MKLVLTNFTAGELAEQLKDAGVTPWIARQLQLAAVRRGEYPSEVPGMPRAVLQRARELTEIPRLELLEKAVSPGDGFAKYLLRGAGPDPFEAVGIPILHRPDDRKMIVCVSSQVGCALGCAFCATGRIGFRRNLDPWEIVGQVSLIAADSPHPVRGVVFMGMGEPMLNYDAVMQAARILAEPTGLAINRKSITISTAGIVDGIRRFTAEKRPYRLILSLTTADPKRRAELMPIEKSNPTPELIAALRDYHAATRRRVTVAWTMMAGVNVAAEDVDRLAALTRGLPIQLNLIDVNDPSGTFRRPTDEELSAFRDALRERLDAPVVRRYSGGQDIRAACGMLAGR